MKRGRQKPACTANACFEERQIVIALGLFDHAGTIPAGFFNTRSSILISRAFKIVPGNGNGLIRQVEAIGASLPCHIAPGQRGSTPPCARNLMSRPAQRG